jgi:phosphatidylserine/phosphatidylglycerophosphate/cardiolipin synthase-like enzyme
VLRRTIAVTLTAFLVSAMGAAPSRADTWVPPGGVAFNQPVGSGAQRTTLVRRVINAVDHTPRGATIRIAAYSFDRKDVADALIRAHNRGVHVQMVLNDNWISTQTRRLRKAFGHNVNLWTFVKLCEGSCRGGAGNLHMKVYSFSHTGAATHVMMTGSANMTDRAVQLQWNDLVTLRQAKGLYDTFLPIFNQLKRDQAVSPSWVYYEEPTLDAQFYRTSTTQPRTATTYSRIPTADEDPVMKRLRAIDCRAVSGYGLNGKSQIRIIMYGWNGERGKYLAEQVARMKKAGCGFKIITSVAGGAVIRTLNEAGIAVKSADYKYLEDGTVDFYSHLKMMWFDGTVRKTTTDPNTGQPVTSYVGTRKIWTGSENWSEMSFKNDELALGLTNATTVDRYKTEFDYLWSKYTHRVGLHPLNKPAYVG